MLAQTATSAPAASAWRLLGGLAIALLTVACEDQPAVPKAAAAPAQPAPQPAPTTPTPQALCVPNVAIHSTNTGGTIQGAIKDSVLYWAGTQSYVECLPDSPRQLNVLGDGEDGPQLNTQDAGVSYRVIRVQEDAGARYYMLKYVAGAPACIIDETGACTRKLSSLGDLNVDALPTGVPALGGSATPPTPPDTAPSFRAESAANQTYTVGTAIDLLTLPEATGGNGTLAYSLAPDVPGLTFVPVARLLVGTPTAAGAYAMTYRVIDADANTAASDAATLAFTITVLDTPPSEPAEPVEPGGPSDPVEPAEPAPAEPAAPPSDPAGSLPYVMVADGATYLVGTQEKRRWAAFPPLSERRVAVVSTCDDPGCALATFVIESISPAGYVTAEANMAHTNTRGEITITGVRSTWKDNSVPPAHAPVTIAFAATGAGVTVRSRIDVEVNEAPSEVTEGSTIRDNYIVRLADGAATIINSVALFFEDPEGEPIHTMTNADVSSSAEAIATVAMSSNDLVVTPTNLGTTTITLSARSGTGQCGGPGNYQMPCPQHGQASFQVTVIP